MLKYSFKHNIIHIIFTEQYAATVRRAEATCRHGSCMLPRGILSHRKFTHMKLKPEDEAVDGDVETIANKR